MELGKAQVEQPRVPNLVLTHQAQVELGKAQVKVGNLPDRLGEEGGAKTRRRSQGRQLAATRVARR